MNFEDKVKHYQNLFGLNNWKITIIEDKQIDNRRAKTVADPRYYTAVMTTYPLLLNDEKAWDEIIVHELIHVVMALYDFFADNIKDMEEETQDSLFFLARENSVSQLTSIIMRIKGSDTNATH